MKLYVFEGAFPGLYTGGVTFAMAESKEAAIAQIVIKAKTMTTTEPNGNVEVNIGLWNPTFCSSTDVGYVTCTSGPPGCAGVGLYERDFTEKMKTQRKAVMDAAKANLKYGSSSSRMSAEERDLVDAAEWKFSDILTMDGFELAVRDELVASHVIASVYETNAPCAFVIGGGD